MRLNPWGSMAEELLEFENTVEDPEDRSWTARVLGTERTDGTWVGWIRFRAADGDALLDTERETTQPNRDDLVYWAKGLTYSYLEGALDRARRSDQRGGDARPEARAEPYVPADTGPRLRVGGAPRKVIQDILGVAEPRAGDIREVPDAGAVVYEGSGGGDEEVHYFALRFGSRNTGAVLSNWLWSRLHGTGALVHVDGQKVELSQDALSHAIVGE